MFSKLNLNSCQSSLALLKTFGFWISLRSVNASPAISRARLAQAVVVASLLDFDVFCQSLLALVLEVVLASWF